MTLKELAHKLAPQIAYALISYSAFTIYTLDKNAAIEADQRVRTIALLDQIVKKQSVQDETLMRHDYDIRDLQQWRRSVDGRSGK